MIRSLLGQKWRPLAIHFEHQAPKDRRPLQAILGAPLEFDQAFNSIIIDARDLDQRLTPGNTAYAPYFERYIKDMLSEQREETTIEQQVAKVISSKLGQEAIGVPEIAVEMGISPRSLQRHLAAEKTSVRIITRNVRLAEAQALLSVNRMHVGAISDALGYADGTAFWRAFKSWAGVSPTAFGRRAARRPSA
jgi:AraC-like DNA-binding protein